MNDSDFFLALALTACQPGRRFVEQARGCSSHIQQGLPARLLIRLEIIMKKLSMCLGLCSVFMLQGCFDNADNNTKGNTDGSKSSVQMQEGKGEGGK